MSSQRHLKVFRFHFFIWKIFGLWSGRKQSKFYNYYSFFYLFFTLAVYNVLLTLNLVYTPRKIEIIIKEVIFYFNEIAVTSKVLMILLMRHKIIEAFDLIDGETMPIDDELSEQIVEDNYTKFRIIWKMSAVVSNFAYFSQMCMPLVIHLITKTGLDLPVCQYYFFSDEIRNEYFFVWFIFQTVGMYGHMMYNVTIDTFVAGMLFISVSQLKILNVKFRSLKLSAAEKELDPCVRENIQMFRLKVCLKRYDAILYYCKLLQDIVDITMFVIFGISAVIICTALCGLFLPSSTETFVFMIVYLFTKLLQVFLPAYLGSQLSYQSNELSVAAYCTEWIPRSESFKRSLMVFVQRAMIPIELNGLKIFSLSLSTFVSIMKSAYSFFALVRSFQDN